MSAYYHEILYSDFYRQEFYTFLKTMKIMKKHVGTLDKTAANYISLPLKPSSSSILT